MRSLTDLERAQVEEVLEQLFAGERPSLVVSHLVSVADPNKLGSLPVLRGEDLLCEGDQSKLAQRVIDVGESLIRSAPRGR
jgi:hypothetical protein